MKLLIAILPFVLIHGAMAQFQALSLEDPNLSPEDLANEIAGPGISISNVSFNQPGPGDDSSPAAGIFSGAQSLVGIETGIILSSGSIANLVGANTLPDIGTVLNTGGDADLEEILNPANPANDTQDATVLEFTFIPDSDTITLEFVFASEEFNEWVGSQFNDVFAFFVNGVNYATIGEANDPITINTVNLNRNSLFYINNDVHGGPPPTNPISIQADGFTTVLTCLAPANAGVANSFKLAIADAGDSDYDSWILIRSGSLSTVRPFQTKIHVQNPLGQPGASNTYHVEFENLEDSSETLLTARVQIPEGFEYLPGSTSGDITSNPSISGNVLIWTTNLSIAAQSSVSWTFDVKAASISGVFFSNVDGTATIPVLQSGDMASVSIGIAQPVGYVRLGNPDYTQTSIPAYTDMAIALPFENPAEYVGTVASISGNTILLNDSPSFKVDRWTGGEPYVLQVESGDSSGLNGLITGNDSNSLTVSLHPAEDLSGLSEGDVISIRKGLTPSNCFSAAGGIGDGDTLLMYSGTSPGVNQSADQLLMYNAGDWYDLSDFSFANQYVIHRSESFIYRNTRSTAISDFLARGVVTLADQRVYLEKFASNQGQDVRISLTSALPVDLNDSGLGFLNGDMVFTFSKGSGYNKSADQIFDYEESVGWTDLDLVAGNLMLMPGDGYVLRRPLSAPTGYTLWTRTQDYAANLPPVMINAQEVAHPQIFPLPPASTSAEFRFKFFAEDGVSYQIQTSTDLVSWSPFETVIGDGEEIFRSDLSVNDIRKFYRVQRQ